MGNKQGKPPKHTMKKVISGDGDDDEIKEPVLFNETSFKTKYEEKFHTKTDTLPVNKVAEWLTSYLEQEHYVDVNAIRADLNDPQHSHIMERMGDDFQNEIDERTANDIVNFLRTDIFNEHSHDDMHGGYLTGPSSTRTSVIFDENLGLGAESSAELAQFYLEQQQNNNFENSVSLADIESRETSVIYHNNDPFNSPKLDDKIMNDLNIIKVGGTRRGGGGGGGTGVVGGRTNLLGVSQNIPRLTIPTSDNDYNDSDGKPPSLNRMRTPEVQIEEDEYSIHKEPFPEFINVALFDRSDDEYLERLIDKAISKVCYGKQFESLWTDPDFVTQIYDSDEFKGAVEKIYHVINTDDNDGLEFIGDFVNKQFKRQINEHKRNIEEKALKDKGIGNENDDDDDDEGHYDFNHEEYDDHKYDHDDALHIRYTVSMEDDNYVIKMKEQDNQLPINLVKKPLFEIDVDEDYDDEEFCWAVFKKKTVKNVYGIKNKGYWEIIEREADDKRERTKREAKRRETLDKVSKDSSGNIITNNFNVINLVKTTRDKLKGNQGRTTKNLNADKYLGNEFEDEKKETSKLDKQASNTSLQSAQSGDSKEEEKKSDKLPSPKGPKLERKTSKKNNKKQKFVYMSLRHLNIIFELLQHHYWHSVKDEKEKKSIAKKQPKLIESPLYKDYCLEENNKKKRDSEYRIKIDDELYRLSWWNGQGRSGCNAIVISIGEFNPKVYFYLRFKHKVDKMLWDWYGM